MCLGAARFLLIGCFLQSSVWSEDCTFQHRSDISPEFRRNVFTRKSVVSLESCAKLCHRNAFCNSAGFAPGRNGAVDLCSLSYFELSCGLEFKSGSSRTPKPSEETWVFCLNGCKVDSNDTLPSTSTQSSTHRPRNQNLEDIKSTRVDQTTSTTTRQTIQTKLPVVASIHENRKTSELDRTDPPKLQRNATLTSPRYTTRRQTTPPITAKVESIFSDISKGFYKLYGTPVTALEANGRCLRDGGFLPRFSDKSQFEAFVHWRNKHEANIDHTELWLDGQNFTSGKWMWNDANSTPLTLNLWALIPVHEALKQNCLVLGSNIAKEYDHFYATDCESIQKYACFFKGANSEDPDGDKYTKADSSIFAQESTLWNPPSTTPSIGLTEDAASSTKERNNRKKRRYRVRA